MELELVSHEPAVVLIEGNHRILIVADLHLGYEKVLGKKGIRVPRLSEIMIHQFNRLVTTTNPSEIIILGDIKHYIRGVSRRELQVIPQMLQRLQHHAKVTIIQGNHDANIDLILPDDVILIPSSGTKLDFQDRRVYLLHGHARPTQEFLNSDLLIMAHIHPTIMIPMFGNHYSNFRVWVQTQLKATSTREVSNWFRLPTVKRTALEKHLLQMQVLIIPAFIDLLHGHVLNQEYSDNQGVGPLFRHLAIDEAELIMLDHSPVGQLKQLEQITSRRIRESDKEKFKTRKGE